MFQKIRVAQTISVILVPLCVFIAMADVSRTPAVRVEDPTRPVYHVVSHLGGPHIADPAFALYWKGKYHLFLISYPAKSHQWSTDMVHWRRQGFTPFAGGCSGTMYINREGLPTAITTERLAIPEKERNIILVSALDDDLDKWAYPVTVKPRIRPDQDASKISTWDPDVWREGDTTYVMLGSSPLDASKEATLLRSKDEKNWEYVGPFMSREMPDVMRSTTDARKNEDLSCPNFFKLGDKWMLLCISHIRGCRYYLGGWKNEQFVPDFHARMNWSLSEGMKDGDHGGDVFAPETILTPDGRRVMWAWLFAQSKLSISKNWHCLQCLPRELSLPGDGILRIKPLRELEQLRFDPVSEGNLIVDEGMPYRLKNISGDAIEVMLTIHQGGPKRYGVKLLCDKENAKGLDLVVEPESKSIKLGSTVAPLDLKAGEDISLRIFVDRSVIEIFANDRQAVVKQHRYELGDVGVCLFSEGGRMQVREAKGWKMMPADP